MHHLVRKFWRGSDGAISIEFAVLIPMVVFGAVSLIDVGAAISEKFSLDQAMRAGAEIALSDPGPVQVKHGVITAYGKQGFEQSVTARRLLTCGDKKRERSKCPNENYSRLFYEIEVSKETDSMLLPPFNLSSKIKVQVR